MNPFGSIPVPRKGRTNFDLSHTLSGTFSLADCQPVVMLQDIIPGDSFRIKVHNLTKLETLIAPAMQQVDASILWFKVPKRLCFNNYKDWYSGGVDGNTDAEKPHFDLQKIIKDLNDWLTDHDATGAQALALTSALFGPGTLWNYFGLPIPLEYNSHNGQWVLLDLQDMSEDLFINNDGWVDAIPFIAYWLIHDNYFMDQTLGKPMFVREHDLVLNENYHVSISLGGGLSFVNTSTNTPVADGGELGLDEFVLLNHMFKRAWRKDYFTSALPTPQRGPEVKIGIVDQDEVPVSIDGLTNLKLTDPQLQLSGEALQDDTVPLSVNVEEGSSFAGRIKADGKTIASIYSDFDPRTPGIPVGEGTADLSGLSPITITAFRNLFKLQAFLEKNNVAGGRFIETILAHWGERVPDFTVQRPVHLRSTSIPVQISEVTAMANSSGLNSQLGDQAGRGKALGNLGNLRIYCQEPCVVMALYCVTVPPAYANQGIERSWQRITRFDEPWRDFQHIGEQAIKNRELFVDWSGENASTYNNKDFGYQQRFSEFKYMPNRIVGDFQTSLAYWTMARIFNQDPYLNEDFVTCQPDERIFAVQSFRPVTANFFFEIKAKRKLSRFSTPKLT